MEDGAVCAGEVSGALREGAGGIVRWGLGKFGRAISALLSVWARLSVSTFAGWFLHSCISVRSFAAFLSDYTQAQAERRSLFVHYQ